MSKQDRRIWNLIYRSHELDAMLPYLPELQAKLEAADRREGTRRLDELKSICARWTIFARYSPRTEKMKEAGEFLDGIRELKKWLR